MGDSMTTALYVIVLAGWFLLMCIVLRCCGDDGSQSIFDLEEINISVLSAVHHKPTAVVDGQPVRFARVQPLGDSAALPGGSSAAAAESGSRGVLGVEHRQQELGLDSLKLPSQAVALPSAEEVWSPILALRTFVEPLTSRASAAFRNLHISFHNPEGEAAGGGGRSGGAVVATASGVLAEAAVVPTSMTTGDGEEEKGGGSAMHGWGRREERPAPPDAIGAATTAPASAAVDAAAANADADGAAAAPKEELREASTEQFWHPGLESGGIELSVVSVAHDRAGGREEEGRTGGVEMKDDDDGYASRVAV